MKLIRAPLPLALLATTAPLAAQTDPRNDVAAPAAAVEALSRIDADQAAIAWDGNVWSRISSIHFKQRIFDDGDRGVRLDTVRFHTPRATDLPMAAQPSSLSAMTISAIAWRDITSEDKLAVTLSASRSRRLAAFSPFPDEKLTSYTKLAQFGWQHGGRDTLSLGWFSTGADLAGMKDSIGRLVAGEPMAASGFRLALDAPLDGTAETAKTRFGFDIRRETMEAYEQNAHGLTTRIGISLSRKF